MYGLRLKELRLNLALSQLELAKKIGTTQNQISKWETENLEPNIATITLLANFFSVSIDYLLGLESEWGVRTIAEPVPTIPDDFQRMLNLYAKLNDIYRAKALGYLEGLLVQQKI